MLITPLLIREEWRTLSGRVVTRRTEFSRNRESRREEMNGLRQAVRRLDQSSTNDFSLPSASSHCVDTRSRYCLTFSIGSRLNLNRHLRPWRTLRTTPAISNTRRCLVIACRVRVEPSVSCAIDCGSPPQSFRMRESLLSSPKAEKTEACARCAAFMLLRFLADMAFNVFHLLRPPAVVPSKRFQAAVAGDVFKA